MRDDHERLMERLRAADPVPTPPQPPTFDALLGDADPTTPSPAPPRAERPAARRTWWPRRPQLAVGLGAMLVLLVAVVVAIGSLGGSSGKLDVVAQARAAISPAGQVVHLVLRGGRVQPDGEPIVKRVETADEQLVGKLSRQTEQWSTALPLRYLLRTDVLGPDGKPVATIESGRAEDGTSWESNSWERRVRFGTSDSLDPDAAQTLGGSGADPTVTVRRLLSAGTLRPNGETTIDGRRALRLTYEAPPKATTPSQGPLGYRFDYLVDPEDYTPIGFRQSLQPPPVPGEVGAPKYILYTELVVERYERLPLDATTRALFVPPPRNP